MAAHHTPVQLSLSHNDSYLVETDRLPVFRNHFSSHRKLNPLCYCAAAVTPHIFVQGFLHFQEQLELQQLECDVVNMPVCLGTYAVVCVHFVIVLCRDVEASKNEPHLKTILQLISSCQKVKLQTSSSS